MTKLEHKIADMLDRIDRMFSVTPTFMLEIAALLHEAAEEIECLRSDLSEAHDDFDAFQGDP